MIRLVCFMEEYLANQILNPRLYLDFYRETAFSMGCSSLIVIDETRGKGIKHDPATYQGFNVHVMESPEGLRSLTGNSVLITSRSDGGQPLAGFPHPAGDVTYITGPNENGRRVAALDEIPLRVAVNTARDYQLWGPVAAGVVLHDRNCRRLRTP